MILDCLPKRDILQYHFVFYSKDKWQIPNPKWQIPVCKIMPLSCIINPEYKSLSTFFNIWYIDDSSLKASLLGPGPMVLHFTDFFYKIKWSIYLYLQVAKKQRMHYTQKISMKKTPLHMFTSIKKVNH